MSAAGQPQGPGGAGGGGPQQGPSEEELRAAYEAELDRVTVVDMLAQTAVSLLNLAARRLGPRQRPGGEGESGEGGAPARDLDQVSDAIDAVRALLGVLDRRIPGELRPLRDALSQLQMAYAAEVRASGQPAAGTAAGAAAAGGTAAGGSGGGEGRSGGGEGGSGGGEGGSGGGEGGSGGGGAAEAPAGSDRQTRGPGPAESSGRLWVPGK
jgi:hypothetical protein